MINLLELHRRFLRYCALEENLRNSTIKAMERDFKTFLRRTGLEALQEMTYENIQNFFYEGRERYQWGFYTYDNHRKYLKKFMKWCVAKGYVQENPVLQIGKMKKPQKLPRRLTQEQGSKILCNSFNYPWTYDFERTRNHAIIATLLFTGIRANELLQLSYNDVDLNNNQILIRSGKGNKDRLIPIHPRLKHILARYEKDKKRLKKSSPYYFVSARSNKGLDYKNLHQICKKISQFSGVKFTPHQLRHTFASVAVDQNMALPKLQRMMGHSNIQSTMIYLQTSTKALAESLCGMELF